MLWSFETGVDESSWKPLPSARFFSGLFTPRSCALSLQQKFCTLYKVLKVVSSESFVSFSVWKTCLVRRLFSYLSSLSPWRGVFFFLDLTPARKVLRERQKMSTALLTLASKNHQHTTFTFMQIIWLHNCESLLVSTTIAFWCHFYFFSFYPFCWLSHFFFSYSLLKSTKISKI